MDISIWKDAYEVGIEQIDRQHKQLIEAIDRLRKVLSITDGQEKKDTVKDVVSFLRYYTVAHFIEEEHYQERTGYAGRRRHKELHQSFIEKLDVIEQELKETDYGDAVAGELAEMMEDWFISHISNEDKKIVKHSRDYIDL